MKLTPLMLPAETWGVNLRNLLGRRRWAALARKIYKRDGYRCRVCGGRGPKHPVECHEEWKVDEDKRELILAGFVSLCPKCHLVQHTGFAQATGRTSQVIKQLMLVNGVVKREAERIVVKAYEDWERRNRLTGWQVVIPAEFLPPPLDENEVGKKNENADYEAPDGPRMRRRASKHPGPRGWK